MGIEFDYALPALADHAPLLEELSLDGFPLSDDALSALPSLPSLRSLELHRIPTLRSSALAEYVAPLTQLRHLSLRGSPIYGTKSTEAMDSYLPKDNFFAACNLVSPTWGWTESLRLLESLDLCRPSGGLTRSRCPEADVDDDAVAWWASSHPALTSVKLAGARITDRGLRALGKLEKLMVVDVRLCEVTLDAVEAVEQQLPGVTVLWGDAVETRRGSYETPRKSGVFIRPSMDVPGQRVRSSVDGLAVMSARAAQGRMSTESSYRRSEDLGSVGSWHGAGWELEGTVEVEDPDEIQYVVTGQMVSVIAEVDEDETEAAKAGGKTKKTLKSKFKNMFSRK